MSEIRVWLEYVGSVIHQTAYRKNCTIDCFISDEGKNLAVLKKKLATNGITFNEGRNGEYYASSISMNEKSIEKLVSEYGSELNFSSRLMADNEIGIGGSF